jgi:hypothetical protein
MFVACAAVVLITGETAPANEIMQLMLLAGVIITYLDNQAKARRTEEKLDENTALTAKTERSINGKTEELVRAASQAAYAKGFIDGSDQERQRHTPKNHIPFSKN